MIDDEKMAEWKRLDWETLGSRDGWEFGSYAVPTLIAEVERLRVEVERARLAGRVTGLAEAAALFDSMHREGVVWEAASFAAQCRAVALWPEIHGYMIWDALHVDESRGASGDLPPEWDVRDVGGSAYVTSCPTREDAERARALLEAVAAVVTPQITYPEGGPKP